MKPHFDLRAPSFLNTRIRPTAPQARCFGLVVFTICALWLPVLAVAQAELPKYEPVLGEVTDEGAWKNVRSYSESLTVAIREIELVPKAEAKPALSIRFLPEDLDAKQGNAALFYLQAMSWAEQTNARANRDEFERKNQRTAVEEGLTASDVPPHSWREKHRPEDLPLAEVKQYLGYSDFQRRYLKEAALRTRCDFDRRIREVESPVTYRLPEIQAMRRLARTQSLRFLAAIAEDKTDDAVAIFGQQLAMATHLSQEPFIVSCLVGIACANIGWYDSIYLCEHENAPNLYWAIASLPKPLANLGPSLAYERNFLFEQAKVLSEVDTTPRPDSYWSRFVDEFSDSVQGLATDELFPKVDDFPAAVASGYPGALSYLLKVEEMDIQTLKELPKTQIFFLGVRKYYERARDEMFKWQYVSYAEQVKASASLGEQLNEDAEEFGLIAAPAGFALPTVQAAMAAKARLQQNLALLQTVESIRNHLAQNENRLPAKLEDLELPAPNDPATDQPFHYVRHSEGASLYGNKWPGYRIQLELRVPH